MCISIMDRAIEVRCAFENYQDKEIAFNELRKLVFGNDVIRDDFKLAETARDDAWQIYMDAIVSYVKETG